MSEGAVYVGRPTKWGNPFQMCNLYTAEQAVEAYEHYIKTMLAEKPDEYNLDELRGKDLCCWCPLSQSCHADVLLEIANS